MRPLRSLRRLRQLPLAAAAAASATALLPLAGAFTPPAASAATAPRSASPVVSPKPGQHVTGHRLRIVVRAGDETGDLAVTLNGRQVGRDFSWGRRGLRVLHSASSHGLRHGRNVLRVRARRGTTVRRATVRFTVTRRAPLAGAGRDRTVTAGVPVRLGGAIHRAPIGGRAVGKVRWRVVRAPAGSRVRRIATPPARRAGGRRRAGAAAAATKASAAPPRAAAAPNGATAPSPLQPLLRPDVVGTYTLQLKVGSGASAKVDTVDYSAVPPDPLVPLDTQLAPASSATGVAQPGLGVGGTAYRMPYLGFERGRGIYDSSGPCCSLGQFYATWQVVAFDRTTLEPRWNRTYGYCQVPNGTNVDTWRHCRSPDNPQPGKPYQPMRVDAADEIMREAPGDGRPGALIVGRTLGRTTFGGDPGGYDAVLGNVGFYAGRPGSDGWPALRQPTAFVGVPGMAYGEADVSARADGELPGFLTADQNYQFHFLSRLRPQFDTRSGASCDAAACTVTQTFGGRQATATVPRGRGGYLISGWDPVTLAPRSSTFATIDADDDASRGETQRLLATLQALQRSRSVVAITTLRTPGMPAGSMLLGGPSPDWSAVTDLVAAFGGTRNGFLKSVSDPAAEYTLVGWAGAGENGGNEAAGLGEEARLRGAFAPDRRSLLRPANVSSVGPPAERISQMMVTPTRTRWATYDGASAASEQAIQCIGAVLKLGVDVRGGYVDLTTQAEATGRRDDVASVAYADLGPVPGTALTCALPQSAFDVGKSRLMTELRWVGRVRDYLGALSTPEAAKGGVVWGQAATLGDELKQAQTDSSDEEVAADALGIVEALLDLIAPGVETAIRDAEKLTRVVAAAAGTFELASESLSLAADGGPNADPRVAADDLAVTLQQKAQAATSAFTQIGDVIVSDPVKLAEVGTYARCQPDTPGGCDPGYEEYAATDEEIAALTDVSLRALGRTIYGTLVSQIYPTWDVGATQFPDDPYASFSCTGTSSPFGKLPSSAWSSGLDAVGRGTAPRSRFFLMIGSGATWKWPPQAITDRMFGATGDSWDRGGLGMDPLSTMRDSRNRFAPGSYSCAFGQ